MAATFASTPAADAFYVAFRVPNLLRELLVDGTLVNVSVPLFAEAEAREGREAIWALANALLGALMLILGVATLVLIVAAYCAMDFKSAFPRGSAGRAALAHWHYLLGLSVSVERHLTGCAEFIRACRAASGNPGLVVMVGGHLISARPALVEELGADAMACDAREAMLTGLELVARRKEGR